MCTLITLIVYALPLHPTLLHRQPAFYLCCAPVFSSVVIIYFVVYHPLEGLCTYNQLRRFTAPVTTAFLGQFFNRSSIVLQSFFNNLLKNY
ncbi:MAG: hypothetical protein IJU19_04840 [Bacteroidales bacterium]|nr:hypothetical protein [Bacteroidales bacterium]